MSISRKNRTPEENARRAKIRELLQEANISSMADIQSLFRETIAEFMENGLEAELDEELGYSKYDFRNKETDNSRNGHSSKKLKTSFGDVEISTPRDRKGEFEPQPLCPPMKNIPTGTCRNPIAFALMVFCQDSSVSNSSSLYFLSISSSPLCFMS